LNPFLQEFDTPFGAVPFDKIENSHYMEALGHFILGSHKSMEDIKSNGEEVTFENTILALENLTEPIEFIEQVFTNIYSAESNDEVREIAKDFSPLAQKFTNDILLDPGIFARVKELYGKRSDLGLSSEQMTLLNKYYKDFTRGGALLDDESKKRVKDIDEELTNLSLSFSDNLLSSTNEYFLEITNVSDLKGLPQTAIDAAKEEAVKKELPNSWVINLQFPSFFPFVTYAENRSKRKELYEAYGKRGYTKDNDNRENILKIAKLRSERAKLLDYETHSHYVLDDRMAKTPEKVMEFLEYIKTKAYPFADKDYEEVQEFAKKMDGLSKLEAWDYKYYFEKLKKEKFDIDDEVLRPFFKLENVVSGAFQVAELLHDLEFNEVNNIPKYHSDVKTYEVVNKDTGDFVGLFYTDFFPREGKRSGAWMTAYRTQGLNKGNVERPHVSIVCNFTKPTKDKPSLLNLNEVLTLFHEFGHALHGLLSNVTFRSLASPNVKWDFVELPSQVLENWVYEKECLDLFAKHFETGAPIEAKYVEKIKESSTFHEGMATMRQVSFAMLDMAWHFDTDPNTIDDVVKFERRVMDKTRVFPRTLDSMSSTAFGHIFSGGYSSGYYSYKWAEVLDADAFEHFKTNGIFNKEISKKFRECILEKGGTEEPMKLYKMFRGSAPDPSALLRRAGLL
jgi:Zn-dependent oligopeptidase